jgi:hypothetical protein
MSYFKHLFPIIFILTISNTACSQNNLNEKENVGSSPLDLKYVNDEAKKLVKSYNDENGTNWKSLNADLRVLVHKCTTPLKAKWSTAPDYYSPRDKEYLYIKVTCDKSVYKDKSWDVLVNTNRPIILSK